MRCKTAKSNNKSLSSRFTKDIDKKDMKKIKKNCYILDNCKDSTRIGTY